MKKSLMVIKNLEKITEDMLNKNGSIKSSVLDKVFDLAEQDGLNVFHKLKAQGITDFEEWYTKAFEICPSMPNWIKNYTGSDLNERDLLDCYSEGFSSGAFSFHPCKNL